MGAPLGEAVALLDQAGQDWFSTNCPYRGLATRKGIPEQAWVLPDGNEVLVDARIDRSAPGRRCSRWRWRCARPAGGSGSTGSAPTWSRPSPTSCGRR